MTRLPFSEILILGAMCGISTILIGEIISTLFNVKQYGTVIFDYQVLLIIIVSFIIPYIFGIRYINKRHKALDRLEELEATAYIKK